MLKKIISFVLSWTLITSQPIFAQGAAQINLGNYLRTVGSSMAADKFRPLHMRYFSYDASSDNFQLLLDKGDNKDIKEAELQEKTKVLMEYFQIGLALPNEKFWVNLRPDAQDQIIDPELERTDMGKIMLEADLQLKKDTAGLTSPQNPEGKAYWDKLYKKAGELFGSENITIPTITRPWIVPGEIILRQGEDSAYIFKANMKVMLEQDHLKNSTAYNFTDPRMKDLNEYSSQLIRELIIPRLTKEVNTSKRYAALRQVFFSLVMARWFKDTFTGKSGQYAQLIDSHNLNNLTSKQSWSKTYYFNEYKKSFEKGEYNLKEDIYTPTGQVIRSYVSGGFTSSPMRISLYTAGKIISFLFVLGSVFVSGDYSGIVSAGDLKQSLVERIENLKKEKPSPEKQELMKKMEELKKIIDTIEIKNSDIIDKINKAVLGGIADFSESNKILDDTIKEIKNPAWKQKLSLKEEAIIKKIEELRANPFKPNDLYHEMYKAYDGLSQDASRAEELAKILKKVLDAGMKRSPDGRIEFPVHSDNEINKILELFRGIPSDKLLPKGQTSEKVFRRAANVLLPREIYVEYFSKSSSSSIGSPHELSDEKVYSLLKNAFDEVEIGEPLYSDVLLLNVEDFNNSNNPEKIAEIAEKIAWKTKFDMIELIIRIAMGIGVVDDNLISGKILSDVVEFKNKNKRMPNHEEIENIVRGASSAVGGIDFRQMNYLVQPMGSFKDLSFGLPILTSSALERINLEEELEKLRDMVKNGMVPSGMRVKEYLAACFQKGKIEEKQDDLLVCLAEIYRLAEEENLETSPELR